MELSAPRRGWWMADTEIERARAGFDRAVARLRCALDAVIGEGSERLRRAISAGDREWIADECKRIDPAVWALADAIEAVEDESIELTAETIALMVRSAVAYRHRAP